jgi:hypothetical protein
VTTDSTTSVAPPAIEVAIPPLSKGEREYRAFQRLLPQLLSTYRGRYVAVHEEQVVDSDPDDIALILRVQARYGYLPIHVGLVSDATPAPLRVPHYRLYRPEG